MFCLCLEQTTDGGRNDRKKAELFYDNVFKPSYFSTVNSVLTDEEKKEKQTAPEIIIQTKLIYNIENKGLQQKLIFNYCLIGRNLNYLKSECLYTDKDLNEKFNDTVGFSKSMRNVYIKLHKLAMTYNKVMYVSVAFRDIVCHMKYLKEFIEADAAFWK